MNENARKLKEIRAAIDEERAEVDRLREILIDNPEYQQLVATEEFLSVLKSQEATAKEALAAELVAEYQASGTKKFPGVGQVKIRKAVTWAVDEAVRWCIGSGMHSLLTVTSEFKKVAEGIAGSVEWIDVTDEPFAAIDSKLEI